MNDLEREVRETLLRHQEDAPALNIAEARRAAGRARRRQIGNVVVGGIFGTAAVLVAIAGLGGLVRADRTPTVLDQHPTVLDPSSPSPTCMSRPERDDVVVLGWPTVSQNPAGVYSWDPDRDSSHANEGFMHNAYNAGSGDVEIRFEGEPGQLIPHRGGTTATVAGCEGTYKRFTAELAGGRDGLLEEWMVDIQRTTVTITLKAARAPKGEVAEAHEIIESIRMEPAENALGFRLVFTLTTNTWDSG